MLNILHVLQELARPIKTEKVELMAIFGDTLSPIPIRNDESKLNCSKDTYVEWLEKFDKSSIEKPNFNTEIFFMAYYAHNLSVITIINKALRRIRVIKELSK
mgnify:CR=1 FL=1